MLAVAALLTILVIEVRTIDRRVAAVKETLKAAEHNTAGRRAHRRHRRGVEAVLAEGLQHHLFLGRVLGKVRIMTTLVVLSVVDIVLLIAGLAIYLFIVGGQLTRIAANLEECAEIVQAIGRNAEPIMQDVRHINRTGGVVAGALPLLYGMAEGIVTGATPRSRRRRDRRPPGVGHPRRGSSVGCTRRGVGLLTPSTASWSSSVTGSHRVEMAA